MRLAMNQKLMSKLLVIICFVSSGLHADVQPYIGIAVNGFSINSSDIKLEDSLNDVSTTTSGQTTDSGVSGEIKLGALLDSNSKISVSYYSGEEKDSEFLTVSVLSFSYDYVFNTQGRHRGWFIGAGISNIQIDAEKSSLMESGEASASGLLFRTGYEYLFSNNVYLESGLNLHTADIELNLKGYGSSEFISSSSTHEVIDIYLSLHYVF